MDNGMKMECQMSLQCMQDACQVRERKKGTERRRAEGDFIEVGRYPPPGIAGAFFFYRITPAQLSRSCNGK